MDKFIKKHLTISSASRGVERLENEIYSKDKNTAVFQFTADELTASKVICLFYFKDTKRYVTVNATIEGNTITVRFDNTLIVTDEAVVCYVYFEKVEQSADVYACTFNVRVSAIDKAQETPLIERKSGRVVDVDSIVTKQELDELFAKIKEQGGTYDDSSLRAELSNKADRGEIERISGQISILEQKTDKDTIYDDSALKQRVSALESKPNIDTSLLVTKQELENKGYLTQHQSLTEYAKKSELPQPYNDTELKNRVAQLESKPNIDTSALVTKQELESKGYLTQHQPLTEYAKKSELPQPYNDTELKSRVSRLESKPEIDTSNFATKQELQNIALKQGPKGDKGDDGRDGVGIPQKLSISGNVVTLSDGGGSITLPTTATPSGTGTPTNEYEIHGTGMPNGRVTAPVGTTYVDTAVTNGALKWIKQKGNDNQGWVVLIGDTGWRNLNIVSKLGASYLRVRRKNDTITYQFGGLSWGWFGIVRRGGAGYQLQPSDRERNVFILGLQGIPQGFRSEGSLIGGIYNDKGTPYGTWYLGGKGDSNMLRFQFTDPVPTDRDIGDIRVSSISYLTDDPWPTTLP